MPLVFHRKTRRAFSGRTFKPFGTLEAFLIGSATTIWPPPSNWSSIKPGNGVDPVRRCERLPRFAVTTSLNRISVRQPKGTRKEGSRDRWGTRDAIFWFPCQSLPVLRSLTSRCWNAVSKRTRGQSHAKLKPLEKPGKRSARIFCLFHPRTTPVVTWRLLG